MALKVDLKIEEKSWKETAGIPAVVRKAAKAGWKDGNVGDLYLPVKGAEVSVMLTNDAMIRELNKDYRLTDKATNVLSFAALDDENEPIVDPLLLGDIVVAYETTKREAEEAGISLQDHLFHLVVHGMLHLIGYDHIEDGEAEEMEALEIKILAANGIGNPY